MPKRILVVDDDENLIGLATIGLQEAGYEVLQAHDGKEGLDAARKHKPDLLLLDLQMPRMHGYQVCEAIKTDAKLSHIKIIIVSAKNYAVDQKTAKNLGADEYMVKPYNFANLIKTIKTVLGETQ